jgi:hypothetical protein
MVISPESHQSSLSHGYALPFQTSESHSENALRSTQQYLFRTPYLFYLHILIINMQNNDCYGQIFKNLKKCAHMHY